MGDTIDVTLRLLQGGVKSFWRTSNRQMLGWTTLTTEPGRIGSPAASRRRGSCSARARTAARTGVIGRFSPQLFHKGPSAEHLASRAAKSRLGRCLWSDPGRWTTESTLPRGRFVLRSSSGKLRSDVSGVATDDWHRWDRDLATGRRRQRHKAWGRHGTAPRTRDPDHGAKVDSAHPSCHTPVQSVALSEGGFPVRAGAW